MTGDHICTRMHSEISDKEIFEQAAAAAYAYMDEIPRCRVFPDDTAIENLVRFDEPLPDGPQPGRAVISQLLRDGSPATVATTGGRYFGFVNGGSIPTALAARWLSDIWDQNAALYVMSPLAAKLEQVCQHWLTDLLGLPERTVAGLVGGTSMATLCGLAAARQAILERMGWDTNANGLFGAPPFQVVVSEQAHSSVFRALALLGLGGEHLHRIAADAQGRLHVPEMPVLDDRTLLILQAGNVNTGAFDALDILCDQARQTGAWVHIDGAFGLWAAASRRTRHLTAGMDKADSWSVDGHKTLNTPYDCGIILCRHRDALATAMQASGAYLQYGDSRDGMCYVPDMSRRARAVELWATLKYLGRKGVAQLVDHLCARAAQFANLLDTHGFRVLNDVVFNQVLVACQTPAQTQATLECIQRSGICWCGGTIWENEPAIRISVCSWATTSQDIEMCAALFVEAREKTLAGKQA